MVMFAVLLDVLVMILLGVPAALFIVSYRHSANVPVDDKPGSDERSVIVNVPVQRRVKQRPSGLVPTSPVVRKMAGPKLGGKGADNRLHHVYL